MLFMRGALGFFTYLEPETIALVARFSTPPTGPRLAAINTLVRTLKVAGLWTKLDALYVLAAAASQAALLNWVSTSYNLTVNGSPTFTADRGYTGTAGSTTVYLETGFNPATAGGQLAQNSAHFSIWNRTSSQSASGSGYLNAATQVGINLISRFTDDTIKAKANDATGLSSANADGSGHYIVSRTASNAIADYKNGASATSNTTASASLYSANLSLLSINRSDGRDGSASQIAAATFGSGLNSTEAAALYAALQAYMTAVGA